LLEGRLLGRIEAGFDANEEFESAGLKGIDDLLKKVVVGLEMFFGPIRLNDLFQLQEIAVSGCMSVRKTVAPGRVTRWSSRAKTSTLSR